MQLQCVHTPQATRKQLQTHQNHVKAESEHRKRSKRRPNFTGAEVEVLLQNVDVSILFHYGYIHPSSVLIYLFTAICSVHILLLFMLGHYDGSVSES